MPSNFNYVFISKTIFIPRLLHKSRECRDPPNTEDLSLMMWSASNLVHPAWAKQNSMCVTEQSGGVWSHPQIQR